MNQKEEMKMEKRKYETPVADMLRFDYRETVVAYSGGGRNSSCLGKNHNSCDGWRKAPGPCYDDAGIKDASHCIGM